MTKSNWKPHALAVLSLAFTHCDSDVAPTAPAANSDAADGGVASNPIVPDAPPAPANCDRSKFPTEDACTIHESVGLFVSASRGSSTGDGSRDRPLDDISVALRAAQPTGRRVYVCAETYDAPLTFVDGGELFGYFDCSAGWRVGQRVARIAPKVTVASRAKAVAKPTRIEGLDIAGLDATEPSQSSIGLIAEDSPGLSFYNVRITAGIAAPGADGANGVQLVQTGKIDGADGSPERLDARITYPPILAAYQMNVPGGSSICGATASQNGGPGGAGAKTSIFRCNGFRNNSRGECGLVIFGTLEPSRCFLGQSFPGLPSIASTSTAAGATVQTGAQAGARGAPGDSGVSLGFNLRDTCQLTELLGLMERLVREVVAAEAVKMFQSLATTIKLLSISVCRVPEVEREVARGLLGALVPEVAEVSRLWRSEVHLHSTLRARSALAKAVEAERRELRVNPPLAVNPELATALAGMECREARVGLPA
jgi:hypothetical protein